MRVLLLLLLLVGVSQALHVAVRPQCALRRRASHIMLSDDVPAGDVEEGEEESSQQQVVEAEPERKLSAVARMRQQTEGAGGGDTTDSASGGIGIPKAESVLPSSQGLVNMAILIGIVASGAIYVAGQL